VRSLSSVNRLALVGLGSIGRRHLRVLKQIRPDIEVILVRSGRGARWPEELLASESVDSIEEAINKGIDAAVISSPAPYHVQQAKKFLSKNIPLLIEKPLSHDLQDIRELSLLADQANVPILVGYVLRHSMDLRYFYELAVSERVGRSVDATIRCGSFLPDWRPDQDYRTTASARPDLGGGVLLELSHELDYANWLFGPFQTIDASLTNSGTLDIEVEDTADIVLATESDSTVAIHLDFCSKDSVRECVIHGSEGELRWDGVHRIVSFKRDDGEEEKSAFDVERDAMFRAQLTHFLSCIEQGETPKVTLQDGIVALTLVEAAKRSSVEGRAIDL
jgi:predicted dehydrogenase